MTGNIVFLNSEKGFGFIHSSGHEKNLFFHAKDVSHCPFEELVKGDEVSFESVERSEKGMSAKGVRLIS